MKKISSAFQWVVVAVVFICVPPFALGHHSVGPHFDTSATVSFDNVTVTGWRLVNPHSYVYFEVEDASGSTETWRCEMSSGSLLKRAGWSQDSLQAGDRINISGSPGRREGKLCAMSTIAFADGSEVGKTRDLRAQQIGLAETLEAGERPWTLDNGQPNISGAWVTLSFGPGAKGGEPPPPLQGPPTWGGYELTAAGLAVAEAYDSRFDDPALGCHPINIIEGWNHDQHVNHIEQTDDKIMLQYGYVDFARTIHLDADQHPQGIEPSVAGYSIGRWDGEVLNVETIGFLPGVLLHQGGVSHTADMRIVERVYRDRGTNELVREYEITDPTSFNGVRKGVDYSAMSAKPYEPYNCTELGGENNRRPGN